MKEKILKLCGTAWKHISGVAYSASDYEYYNQKKVYNRMLASELTSEMFLLKPDNKKQNELMDTLCLLANRRRAGILAQSSQIEEVQSFIKANMQYMTTEFLDRMEQVTIAAGLFVLAYAIREQNENLVLQQAGKGTTFPRGFLTKANVTKLLWCYIDHDEHNTAHELLNHPDINKKPALAKYLRSLYSTLGLIEKDTTRGRQNPPDASFADYVKGKNIAIIGPSPSDIDPAEEILRDFDVVIRMNFRGLDKLPEAESNIPVHVAYYRDRKGPWKKAAEGESFDYLSELDFVVLRGCDKETHSKVSGYTNVRTAISQSGIFFLPTKPNVMQLILLDLSFFEPARIKVFNANFFLAKNLWYKGYKVESKNFISLWHGKAIHNYVCQYQYARHLYKRGMIEADKRLTEVLELGTAEYVRQIELQENQRDI